MSEGVTKADVPAYGHPALWIFAASSLIGLFAAGTLIVQDARPGIVEMVVGVAWAPVFSRPLVRAWIAYLESTAVKTRQDRLIKSLPMSLGTEWCRMQAGELICLAGMFVVSLTAYLVWLTMPALRGPWARYAAVRPDFPVPIQSMATAGFVYLIASALALCTTVLRWYRALPDGGS